VTARDRAHRAFTNAFLAGDGVPACHEAEGMRRRGLVPPPCGTLCDRVTDAIEIARAHALADAAFVLKAGADKLEADR
jgi:hypothetical protein